jgi:hypothetical protein
VLHDLDRSLSACLAGWLPDGTEVRVAAPDTSWVSEPGTEQFVAVFLYDLREQAQATAAAPTLVRDGEGRALGWRQPVRHYRASYLVSAWPGTQGASEHELLDAILVGCAASGGAIPDEHLAGSLADAPDPVLVRCAPAERSAEPISVWSSLRVPARTALDLLVIAPLVPPLTTDLAPGARSIEVGVATGEDAVPQPEDPAPQRWESARVKE